MELVIGKLKARAISTALADKPCSSGSDCIRASSLGCADIAGDSALSPKLGLALAEINKAVTSTTANLVINPIVVAPPLERGRQARSVMLPQIIFGIRMMGVVGYRYNLPTPAVPPDTSGFICTTSVSMPP